ARIQAWLGRAVVSPFYEMYERAGGLQLAAIAVFIVLFKFGDSLPASMSNPLYVALEFTKVEVATISKVYGVIATRVGVAGGALAEALGWIPFFVVCTLFCAPALLLLLWLMRRPIGVPVASA